MTYRELTFQSLKDLKETLPPDSSFGDFLYSFLRKPVLKKEAGCGGVGWLRDITDQQFYYAISCAINDLQPDSEFSAERSKRKDRSRKKKAG